MADSFVKPETDVAALTEALKSQQHLLQKLYSDLDQEREASSTAADEALSMILRLQGEKSAVKMEANQYKRLAEEKICHAEEALAIFEDLIYQKEMEIASLEFQLQAYRYKLMSLGVATELGFTENVYPENLLQQQRGEYGEASGVSGTIRRINSLPPLELKNFLTKKCSMKKGDRKLDKEVSFHGPDPEKKSRNNSGGNINSIWDQIKKLDDRVKEISDCKDSGGRGKSVSLKGPSRTCSLSPIPTVTTNTSHDAESEVGIASRDHVNTNKTVQEREAMASTSCSTGVHDVFEVPEYNSKTWDSPKALRGEKECNGKDDVKCDVISDDTERVKKMFHSKLLENRILSRTTTVDATAREKVAAAVRENQVRFQQLWRRIERLEGQRCCASTSEISHTREEELKMFRDISEQLTLIRSKIHCWKPKSQDDEPLQILQEKRILRAYHFDRLFNETGQNSNTRDISEQLTLIRSKIHCWKPKSQDDEPLQILQEAMLQFWL